MNAKKKRYKYIKKYFEDINKVCEIGASIGSFLELLNEDIIKCAVEPNDINRNEANNFSDYQYEYVDDIPENLYFDIICMFHTFEHIKNPISFLETCKKHLQSKGKLIIEVTYIRDPLITLYNSKEFKDFYFQKMHPYIYSKKSLNLTLENAGFYVDEFLYEQRYSVSNHLEWLSKGKPGGNSKLENLFNSINNDYINILEKECITDIIFIIASH
ncbi:MAG: class I SAM-dependent methyltransferase [bacterium]